MHPVAPGSNPPSPLRLKLETQGGARVRDVNASPFIESVAFKTDSPASIAENLRRFWSRKAVVPHERGGIGYELTALWSRRLAVGRVSSRVGRTSRASAAKPMLQVPLDCSADVRVGRMKFAIRPGEAILLPPGHEYTEQVSAGSALFLQVDTAVLIGGLPAGRAGRSRHWVMRCVPIDVSQAPAVEVLAEVDALLPRPEVPSSGDRCAEFADLERRVVSWLTDSLLDRGGLRSSVPAASQLAECAGEWIDSNISGPITLDALAGQFGVSGRWLQKSFMAYWGLTPMDYVTTRRLMLARSSLMSADGPSVTSVAVRCGFTHLGRFAGLYREAYGESPSETVARAKMRRQLSDVAGFTESGALVPSGRERSGRRGHTITPLEVPEDSVSVPYRRRGSTCLQ